MPGRTAGASPRSPPTWPRCARTRPARCSSPPAPSPPAWRGWRCRARRARSRGRRAAGARAARRRSGVGQVLLTAQDIGDRARYLNARNTLLALLGFGVLPIVNENDTVATEEIKVGDNDNLSALVASLIQADLLVLLTDVDGLFTANPATSNEARKLDTVEAITEDITRLVWAGAGAGAVGGMATKLQAAQKAAAAGVPMIIANGRVERVVSRLLSGEMLGTYFAPKADRLGARKRWIAFAVPPQGRLTVEAGAGRALTDRKGTRLTS